MADMIPMGKLLAAAKKEYPNLNKEELTALIGLQIEAKQAEVNALMKSSNKGGYKLAKAKGGNISNQMEMFEEGGLKDEGGTVDPISGNDVPSGSTQEEVRDDIPAQLSEGEFVFPADVVRYLGLEKLMTLRQEAKQGLKTMEDMGQMGNSEEATMRDDMPFDINDIDMEDEEEYNSEEMEMAQGGVVYAATGFGGTVTSAGPNITTKASNFGNTATRTPQPKTYTPPPLPTAAPTGGFKYGATKGAAESKLSFDNLFKDTGAADEYKTYVNDAGAEIQVPFKNGKLMTGFTIPEGYKLKTEKVDTAKTQTTKTKTARVQQESSDGSDSRDSQTVVSLGGEIGSNGRVTGGKSFAFSINPPKDMGINMITMAKMVAGGITGNYPEGTTFNFQTLDKTGRPVGGIVKNVPASVYQNAKTIVDKNGVKRTSITSSSANDLANKLGAMENFDAGDLNYDELNNLGLNTQQIMDNIKNSQFTKEQERKAERITSQKIGDGPTRFEGTDDTVTSGGTGTQVPGGISYVDDDPVADTSGFSTPSSQPSDNNNYSDQSSNYGDGGNNSDDNSYGDSEGSMGGMGDFNIGGLAGKKKQKIKVKKMKRGGLASRK